MRLAPGPSVLSQA